MVLDAVSPPQIDLDLAGADFCGSEGELAAVASCSYFGKRSQMWFFGAGQSLFRPPPRSQVPSNGKRYHIHTFGCQVPLLRTLACLVSLPSNREQLFAWNTGRLWHSRDLLLTSSR